MRRDITVALVVLLLLSPVVAAQVTTVQQTPADGGSAVVGEESSDYFAQAFEAQDGSVLEIGAYLYEALAEGEVRLGIAPPSGGNPDVDNMLFVSDLIDPTPTESWINISADVQLTAGETYYLVIDGYQNSGATGASTTRYSSEFAGVQEELRYSNDGGSSWDTASDPMAVYIGYGSVETPTDTPTDGTASQTPGDGGEDVSQPDDPQSVWEIWQNYQAFVAFIVLAYTVIGVWSKSLAVGAFTGYMAFLYLALTSGSALFENIAYVTLILVFLGFAFKLIRLEFEGEA